MHDKILLTIVTLIDLHVTSMNCNTYSIILICSPGGQLKDAPASTVFSFSFLLPVTGCRETVELFSSSLLATFLPVRRRNMRM